MTYREPTPTVTRTRSLVSASSPVVPTLGLTVFDCGQDEAAVFRRLAPRLGVRPILTQAAVSPATLHLVAGHRCISISHKARVDHSTLVALSDAGVGYVSTRSVGYDHVDVRYARSLGITVENVSYSPDSVADYTLMLILMAVRNAQPVLRSVQVRDYRLHEVRGKELRDLTVGVVGTGRIGSAVVARLTGFGGRVLTCDRGPRTSGDQVPLDELLERSDVVTLHVPLTAHTHHLLDRERIGRLRRGAVVVNTGRGALLDTGALLAALESGWLGGAALDVVEGEEGVFYADCRGRSLGTEHLLRLHELPNVVITPHTAFYTDHALRDTVQNSILNCLMFERGSQHA